MTTAYNKQVEASEAQEAQLLRNVLKGNALFSAGSGLALIVAGSTIADFLGLSAPAILTVTGFLLLIFAGDLLFLATRERMKRGWVTAVIIADTLWVIGSIILLITDPVPFTSAGKWAIGLVALIVATFAELQYYGLRKMSQA